MTTDRDREKAKLLLHCINERWPRDVMRERVADALAEAHEEGRREALAEARERVKGVRGETPGLVRRSAVLACLEETAK